ncbi:MAG: hypothetical protein RLZ59_374 [Pseudomonadota bacterium]
MAADAPRPPLCARVDNRGILVAADAPLLRLILMSGGHIGSELAVPQLAALVRLVRQKGAAVTQQAMIGDGPNVRLVDVEAVPDGDGIHLTLHRWDRLLSPPEILGLPDADFEFARLEADGAWRTDAQLLMVRMAAAIDVDFGFLPATTRGHPFSRIFRLLPDATGDIPFLAALANGTDFTNQPAELIVSHIVPVLLSGRAIVGEDGRFLGISGRLQLVRTQPKAPSHPPILSDLDLLLAGQLEPALRGPIGRAIEHADHLALQAEGPLRQDYVRYAEDIAGAARHLLGLVDDLANLNAIEQPNFAIETEALDVADIARRAAGLLAVRRTDQGLSITWPDNALWVAGEFGRVLQILVNLLTNAIRYSPEGGQIRMEAVALADMAGIAVIDAGKGIAPEHHDRIFRKFERLDGNIGSGSGLGLYISRRLARAMGGDILLDSQPGQGARFTLLLKACDAPIGSAT